MRHFSGSFSGLGATRRNISELTLIALLVFTPTLSSSLLAQTAPKAHRTVVKMVDPEYPTVLRNGHFEGQVIIEATVLPNGTVSKADVKGGNPMLSQFAAQAVLKWKYVPGPDKTIEEVTFRFNASDR